MLCPVGKSLLRLTSLGPNSHGPPCQDSVQPPVWFWMLSALLPTTRTRLSRRSGRTLSLFLSSTSDSRTARRASARSTTLSSSPAKRRSDGRGRSNSPARSLTRRMRVTASSMRDMGITPASTSAIVLGMKATPVVRHHEQVDAGVDRLRAVIVGAAGHLADRVPVRDDEAVESDLLLDDLVHQVLVARVLALVLPAEEADHDGLRAAGQRAEVALAVDVDELRLRREHDALVDALLGAAVGDVVLGRAEDAVEGRQPPIPVVPAVAAIVVVIRVEPHDALGDGRRELADHARLLRPALVGPAPPIVAHHREAGTERPVLTRGADRALGRLADLAHQAGVARGAQPDVVREDRRAEDVVVAVHRVDAPEGRNLHFLVGAALVAGDGHHRGSLPDGIGQREPVAHRGVLVRLRPRAAAVQHRAERGLGHLFHAIR